MFVWLTDVLFFQYGRANQDYKIQNLTLKERIAELERQGCGEIAKLERRLHKELAVCFSELYSLVQICVQRAEGQDPNISVLLGVKGQSMDLCDLDWNWW